MADLYLRKIHMYYYQVQLQMKPCHVQFCDFVAYREDEIIISPEGRAGF